MTTPIGSAPVSHAITRAHSRRRGAGVRRWALLPSKAHTPFSIKPIRHARPGIARVRRRRAQAHPPPSAGRLRHHPRTAIDQAATAVDPAQHAAALRRIIDLYTGAVADGHNWLWLAPYREATRRHIVDAYVALAEGEPQPREALALIQDAIRLDPYNEDLYQHAMRLHARLASPDGVRRTLRTLTERLSELEVRISPQTQQVAAELIERLGTRERIHSERIQHGAA